MDTKELHYRVTLLNILSLRPPSQHSTWGLSILHYVLLSDSQHYISGDVYSLESRFMDEMTEVSSGATYLTMV